MDKYPYVIGSFEKMSDVVIKAQVVSRMHCCIYHEVFKDDEYLIAWLFQTLGNKLEVASQQLDQEKKLLDAEL